MKQNTLPEGLAPVYDMLSRCKRLALDKQYPLATPQSTEPFFIIGSGRCGSTLLRRMLQASPEIHIPPESYVLGELGRLFMRNRQMDWHHLVNLVLSTFEYQREFDKFEVNMYPVVQMLWEIPEKQRSLATILDVFYRYHGEQTGQTFTLWGDKTPKNTFDLDILIRIFPKARFIHLLRDGVDVAASFAARGLIPDVFQAAKHWQKSVCISREFMNRYPKQCFEMRYEDLVVSPQHSIQPLCSFLGVPFDADMIDAREHIQQMGDLNAYQHYEHVLDPVSVKHMGQGRASLSELDLVKLKQRIGDTLEDMGYHLSC